MMTSSRSRQEIAGNPPSRRGHTNQLSISDPSHHVTEAIGTLYGDEDDSGFESGRPLSFISGSQYHEQLHRTSLSDLHERPEPQRPATSAPRRRSVPDQPLESPISQTEHGGLRKAHTFVVPPSQRTASPYEQGSKSPASPTSSLRDVQADPSGSQFPLANIDNPSDISLELSNLKALRRLSMDVGNNIDPDMPPMGLSAMPVVAPSGDDDENDPSRLLWVPARVHPELAPTEFKSFLEKRVQSIRRRSGDSFLSADGNSGFCGQELSIRRHKSMLSRQIDNTGGRGAVGYVDGAERLERQRSSGGQDKPELSLEELVKDPSKAVQRLAQESHGASMSLEDGGGDDVPILPMAPGAGLRRSTRTTYRKGGSVRSGDRGSLSRRFMRHSDGESPYIGSSCLSDTAKGFISPRVHYEPAADNQPRTAEAESTRRRNNLSADTSHVISGLGSLQGDSVERRSSSHVPADQLSIRTSTSSAATQNMAVASERVDRHESQASQSFPQRSSQAARTSWDHPETIEDNATRPGRRPPSNKPKHATQHQYTVKPPISSTNQMMSDTLASPSSLTCADASRTDSLTFIPTLSQPEKKVEKRSKRDKDDDSSGSSSRSGSAWKWLKGVTDDHDRKEESRRAKARASVEKSQDNARLDVIQTSIDKNAGKGRESLVLDRDNVDNKLLEERRKESHRKSNSKKDKDGSIFSSIFGGSRKKEEKEKGHNRSQYLQVPEDVPYTPLTPDVDYHWARFPLLEERAIYRMAHIKLANSRRPLLSQVLLSNFMYSYLAIVQAMHPQMNVPTSPQQKRLEEEARRKRQEEEYLARQQIHGNHSDDHGLDQYNFDYHRATVQYAECGSNGQVDYVDDAQIYEDEHGDDRQDDYRYEGMEGFSRDTKDYLDSRGDKDDRRRQGQDDMW